MVRKSKQHAPLHGYRRPIQLICTGSERHARAVDAAGRNSTQATRLTLMLCASFSTWARSYSICMPSHTSGRDRRLWKAALPSRPRCYPCRLPNCSRFARVTPSRLAASVTVNPNGSMHSWRQCVQDGADFSAHDVISLMIIEQSHVLHFARSIAAEAVLGMSL